MHIAFFGSSLVSCYWNVAATYYRGILRALHDRGHSITFYEPDAYQRQQHRDIPDPPYAAVVVYPGDNDAAARKVLHDARVLADCRNDPGAGGIAGVWLRRCSRSWTGTSS